LHGARRNRPFTRTRMKPLVRAIGEIRP
jgi:hypothetical protein